MSKTSVGSLGTGGEGNQTDTSLAFNTSAQLDAGNEGILAIVTDNNGATGQNNEHSSVTDDDGNTYTKLYEYTYSPGGVAADGVTVSIWRVRPAANLASGATVTVTLANAVTDKVASFWEFTATDPLAYVAGSAQTNGAATTATSQSISGLASKEYLFFRVIGKEINSTTALTPTANFTAITGQRSRNNANAVIVRGEFRIVTATGETSAPTFNVLADTVELFIAIEESAAGGGDVTVTCESAWAAGYALAPDPSASVALSAVPGEACDFALMPSASASVVLSLPAAGAVGEAGTPAPSAGATVSAPAAASAGEGLALSTSAGVSVAVVPAEAVGQGQPPDVFVGLIVEAPAAGTVAFGLPAVASANVIIAAPHADAAGFGFEPNPFIGLIVDLAPGYGAAFGTLPVVSAGASVAAVPGVAAGAALEGSASAGAVVLVPVGDAAGFGLEPGASAAALVGAPAGAAAALGLPAAALLPGGDIAVLAELGAALGFGMPAEAAIVVFGGLRGAPGAGQLAGEQEARLAGEKERRLG